MIDEITRLKAELNKELIKKIQKGEDVNIFRNSVDSFGNRIKRII